MNAWLAIHSAAMDELSLDDLLGALEDVQQQKSTVRASICIVQQRLTKSSCPPPPPPSLPSARPPLMIDIQRFTPSTN